MTDADRLHLPRSSCELVRSHHASGHHPGLLLDKLSPVGGNMASQREALRAVTKCLGDDGLLQCLRARRGASFDAMQSVRRFEAKTQGPLTLHLARAGVLENAGIALHPIYGFVHLPGSGLKGLARAWAETVWAPGQPDPEEAWRQIETVFGWSAGSEGHKRWRNGEVGEPEDAAAGRILFHDAWPLHWPQLEVDIVNNHHTKYYAGNCDPGDWEDPVPVYFLAVGAGVSFEFALSDRRPADDGLLGLAQNWLAKALVVEGAGAKTAAGYGRFEPLPEQGARPEEAPLSARYEIRLAAPAFLAGAQQAEADCDLRPATLRGLLRWWWRTMHAAHVDRAGLRRLETAVWGDARTGSPVRLALAPAAKLPPEQHPRKNDGTFLQTHGIRRPGRGRTVTQGLFYASYGMAEQEKYRWAMPAGAAWTLTLTARNGHFAQDAGGGESRALPASLLLEQAGAALWLLMRFGGAGSRSRKGFGSFDDLAIKGLTSIGDCLAAGKKFRDCCGIAPAAGRTLDSPALDDALVMEMPTTWKDPWFVLDRTGEALQLFAKNLQGKERLPLGLPRRTGRGPDARPLRVGKIERHASPALWSLAASPNDHRLTVRLIAFPAARLPDRAVSAKILRELVEYAKETLANEVRETRHEGQRVPSGRRSAAQDPASAPSGDRPTLEKGTRVQARLIAGYTKKGGWGAHHEPTGRKMAIQNTGDVPDTAKHDDEVELLVFANDAFRWLTDEVRQYSERNRGAQGAPRGGPSRRRGFGPGRGGRR